MIELLLIVALFIILYFVVRAYFEKQLEKWKEEELEKVKLQYREQLDEIRSQYNERVKEVERVIEQEYKVKLEEWKNKVEDEIRRDAIARSSSTIRGKVAEQLAPFELFQEYGFNMKDMRFIGSPIDYVVFDGLDEGELKRIVFVEVKTGVSGLSKRERMIRDVVNNGKVEWLELRLR